MTVTSLERPTAVRAGGTGDGGMVARRAVTRWAWRLFRREWRQQLLVLALIVIAVAATILGATVALDGRAPVAGTFGNAQDLATLSGSDTKSASQIAALEQHFGKVDVIESETLPVPGSVDTYQLRAQDPNGAYGTPMLSLVSGHYPSGSGQVAMTSRLASHFGLRIGDVWHEGGTSRQLVGIVSNPQSLLDEFALVPPGQLTTPTEVTVLFDARGTVPSSIAPNVQRRGSATSGNAINPETISLAGLTIGMLLIALVSVGGFTVLAQRRLRSLGMLGSLGATDRNVSLVVRANGVVTGVVGAVIGMVVAFLLWLAYRPHLESSSHHVIGVWAIPWLVVLLAVVLAMVATYFAASRPAKAMARVPIVQALSGRPAPPRRIHRSAVPGIVFFVAAFILLGISGGSSSASGNSPMIFLVLGLGALIPGVILLSPFFLTALAKLGGRTPLAVRLALRDLARYRARSGSALSAISVGVLVAVIVAIVAAARYGNTLDYAGPNLASNQIIVYTPSYGSGAIGPDIGNGPKGGGGPGSSSSASLTSLNNTAHAIGASLGTNKVVELYTTSANLDHANSGNGRNWNGPVYVGTPSLLKAFGINPSEIDPNADVLTMRPGISTLSGMQLTWSNGNSQVTTLNPGQAPQVQGNGPNGEGSNDTSCTPANGCLANPVIQQVNALPSGTSAPNTVITEHALKKFGLESTLSTTGWLIQTTNPITASQLNSAQGAAAAANMTVESKNDQPTSGEVIDWATVFGVALALAILAMSIGLIRSETASDLRTLTATGASSRSRRTITAATAGSLGFLGGLLGTVAGYVGVIGWIRTNSLNGGISALGNVPVDNLLIILVGMPLIAAAAGWVFAGREPPAFAHQPLE